MTPLQCRRDPRIRRSHRGSPRPGDGDLPSDAFWRACRVRPRLAGFFQRGVQRPLPPRALDIGDPPWRTFPVTTPDGRVGVRSPSASLPANRPTARIGAAHSAIVVARGRDVCQRVEVWAPGIALGLASERRPPFGGLEPIAWGRWQVGPEAAAPLFFYGPMDPLRSYTGRQGQRRLLRYSPTRSAVTTPARTGLRGM